MWMFSDESKLHRFMVCCVDFPVQTVKPFLSCIIGAGTHNHAWPALPSCQWREAWNSGELMLWGWNYGWLCNYYTETRPSQTHCLLSFPLCETEYYMVRLPCISLFIHKLSEIVLHSDLFMLLYESRKCLKLVDVSVIFLLHIPWE